LQWEEKAEAIMSNTIRSGRREDARWRNGEWLFIDLGFSATSKSTGWVRSSDEAKALTYGRAVTDLITAAGARAPTLNLVLEAPLSVAFTRDGNPTMRTIERRKGQRPRPWYSGAGAAVLLAAMHLLRKLQDAPRRRDIFLFEGFVSFKPADQKTSHTWDVREMREVIQRPRSGRGRILEGAQLKMENTDQLESAFKVMGLDLGVPAVIEIAERTASSI